MHFIHSADGTGVDDFNHTAVVVLGMDLRAELGCNASFLSFFGNQSGLRYGVR